MAALLVHLDEETFKALNRIAPAAQRKRAEFIRQALKEAIRKREYDAMREAYAKQPDSAAEADAWQQPEAFHG